MRHSPQRNEVEDRGADTYHIRSSPHSAMRWPLPCGPCPRPMACGGPALARVAVGGKRQYSPDYTRLPAPNFHLCKKPTRFGCDAQRTAVEVRDMWCLWWLVHANYARVLPPARIDARP